MNTPARRTPAAPAGLASPLEQLDTLTPAASRLALRGLEGADNTRRAYASDLRSFTAYCTKLGLPVMPTDVPTLTGYIAHLTDLGRKLTTINRHLAAIGKLHSLNGHSYPSDDVLVKATLDGVAREKNHELKQAPDFSTDQLKSVLRTLDLTTPVGLRDRALLLLGFAGAFRREELVALNVESVHRQGMNLVVKLAKSKANQTGKDERKVLFPSPSELSCPVRAVEQWIEALHRSTGPLFVRIRRGSGGNPGQPEASRLSDWSVNQLVKKHLGPHYTAHSLRASFVTMAVRNGSLNKHIRNQTGQKTDSMIERYTRMDDLTRDNAAQNLGL
jgi:site-specific recombinase XerD